MHKACAYLSYYGAVTFFLQMEEVRQDVAAPETQHTCNAARCYAMQASQTCLWPNKQQRKITTTTKKNNNNNNNNNNNITDIKWYWKLQSNSIFILTLYCIKLLCPFHFAKYRQMAFDLCLRLKLNLCKIQTFDLSLCCSVSAIIDYLCLLFVSIAFCVPPSLTCKPSGMGRYNVAECTLECIDLCYRALSLVR